MIRVPLMPGITDTNENLTAIAEFTRLLPGLIKVNLLYNRSAGAKYKSCGLAFEPKWQETQQCNANTRIFEEIGIKVQVG